MQLMAERLESLKAGIIGGVCLCVAFLITSVVNTLVLARYFPLFASLQIDINWRWWLSGGIAAFSGLLFGVTYRYIIRKDQNPQLKSGGVLAFGLVRGLTQIDCAKTILPGLVLAGESVLWFAIGAIALDSTIQIGWIKPFGSTNSR
ncbi:hypothetical protein [Nodularia sphaerocarpa]|uniref:hypothetical protein n=1 Tax=Nodularia sphaerocarpa TaxID=137816 RepID=UPI001EFA4A17|nr:hypothetical protein [Nodularia sphaerocarpa]MDB9375606.1 hypothetical protein [Nodularia sphaerocarpa CS-585]MDB9379790.1 hypothetical protein [Nodularia sphaerocarpa CS-585A2]ULP72144.1 hypothetical protein BDGGKGIB_01782 [Nodularia sphaerocarpa UHCC 0038]